MVKKIFCTFLLVVFISTVITVNGGQLEECQTPRCGCCKDKVCRVNDDFCTNGCIDGVWGYRCYNPCPGNCATCTGTEVNGKPCTSCIAGKYGSDCSKDCPTNCATCTLDSTDGGYPCTSDKTGQLARCTSSRCGCCKDKVCRVNDDFCTNGCIDGVWGYRCYNPCPGNCATCTGTEVNGKPCTSCIAGKYGSDCSKDCPTNCATCTLGSTDGGYPCTTDKTGQLARCTSSRCGCCKDKVCRVNDDFCTNGCIDGVWGYRCYNPCPGNCATCTGTEVNGKPCTSCIAGKYGSDCSKDCPANCATCTLGSTDGGYPCTTDKTGQLARCMSSRCGCCNDNVCRVNDDFCTNGCVEGIWGNRCYNPCPGNCATCTQTKVNGIPCTSCIAGKYGSDCSKDCPTNCATCTGTKVNGVPCTSCIAGKYGSKCGYDCPANCADCTINTDSGYPCTICITGYTGDKCDKCVDGYYRKSSSDTNCIKCSNFCKTEICDELTGYCLNGCLDKYWGVACLNNCPNDCLMCRRETGICDVCDHSKYKSDCSANCNAECQKNAQGQRLCKIQNGHCLTGCRTETLYGPLCQNLCSKNCINNKCNWETGYCYECEGNKYGLSCEIDCGNNCMQQGETQYRCYGSNGTCIHGCTHGYYGDTCDFKCSQNCKTSSCSRITGQCLDGCLEGLEESGTNCVKVLPQNGEDDARDQGAVIGGSVGGSVAVIVLVVIFVICVIRRRHHDNNRSGDTSNTSGNQPTHTYNNTHAAGQTTGMDQSTTDSEMVDEIPEHKLDCDQIAIYTIDTDNYDNLDCQQDGTGQYDTLEETNKAQTDT